MSEEYKIVNYVGRQLTPVEIAQKIRDHSAIEVVVEAADSRVPCVIGLPGSLLVAPIDSYDWTAWCRTLSLSTTAEVAYVGEKMNIDTGPDMEAWTQLIRDIAEAVVRELNKEVH